MTRHFTIDRGLKLPISGEPVQDIKDGPEISRVGIVADDFVGFKPTILVEPGQRVLAGQPVMEDKKTPGVLHTAPAAGVVEAVNRGEKRRFLSMVLRVEGNEAVKFRSWNGVQQLSSEEARSQLLQSGLWTAFRTRPFNKVPVPGSEPHSIFVTAIDTNPLAAEPELVISQNRDMFSLGLEVVAKLTAGKIHVCTRNESRVNLPADPDIQHSTFEGLHPAGLPGTHIHLLDPVGPKKSVWFIGYQDVIAVGELFALGQVRAERVVSVAGPSVKRPGLYRTRLGAELNQLMRDQLQGKNARVISGSVLAGRSRDDVTGFLGRFHLQVTALPEGNEREFLGWQKPGADRFSITRAFLGGWLKPAAYRFTTNTNGSHRAMVPIGAYERVMPLDILPTQLLRALLTGNTEEAQALGALELDEEDLALCTFVCPGKYDYGAVLRENLATIEKEG